jgi:hypothetical protein
MTDRKLLLAGIAALALAPASAQTGGGVAGGGQLQNVAGAYGGSPAYSSGCGGSATFGPGSNNVVGSVTFGATAVSCVITWGAARLAVPFCQLTNETAGSAVALGGVPTATGLTITMLSTLTATVSYLCNGV